MEESIAASVSPIAVTVGMAKPRTFCFRKNKPDTIISTQGALGCLFADRRQSSPPRLDHMN